MSLSAAQSQSIAQLLFALQQTSQNNNNHQHQHHDHLSLTPSVSISATAEAPSSNIASIHTPAFITASQAIQEQSSSVQGTVRASTYGYQSSNNSSQTSAASTASEQQQPATQIHIHDEDESSNDSMPATTSSSSSSSSQSLSWLPSSTMSRPSLSTLMHTLSSMSIAQLTEAGIIQNNGEQHTATQATTTTASNTSSTTTATTTNNASTIPTSGNANAASASTIASSSSSSSLREVGSLGVWSLSSAKVGNGIAQLRDNQLDTFWQSDGQQPHTITIQFARKTKIQVSSRISLPSLSIG